MKKLIFIALFAAAFVGCWSEEPHNYGTFTYRNTADNSEITLDLQWAGYMDWYKEETDGMDELLLIYLSDVVVEKYEDMNFDTPFDALINIPVSLVGQTIDLTKNDLTEGRLAPWQIALQPNDKRMVEFRENNINPSNQPIRSGSLLVTRNGANIGITLELVPASGDVSRYNINFKKDNCFYMRPWLNPGTGAPSFIDEQEAYQRHQAKLFQISNL